MNELLRLNILFYPSKDPHLGALIHQNSTSDPCTSSIVFLFFVAQKWR